MICLSSISFLTWGLSCHQTPPTLPLSTLYFPEIHFYITLFKASRLRKKALYLYLGGLLWAHCLRYSPDRQQASSEALWLTIHGLGDTKETFFVLFYCTMYGTPDTDACVHCILDFGCISLSAHTHTTTTFPLEKHGWTHVSKPPMHYQ